MPGEMTLEERAFRSHIEKGPFRSGVAQGHWRLISINWPFTTIAVSAASRPNGPSEYAFRFNLTNYTQMAPTACPWNCENDTPLEDGKRPHGGDRVNLAFRTDWKNGIALYLPCDREAMDAGHAGWQNTHPWMLWNPNGDITQYLRIIHDLLNSKDYKGPRNS